jgi:hypothetical protein
MIYNARLITYTRSGSAFLGYLINDRNMCKIATGSHQLNRLRDGELLITCIRNPVDVIASSIVNELKDIKDFEDFCYGQIKGYVNFHEEVLKIKSKVIVDFNRLTTDTDAYMQEIAFRVGCQDYMMPEYVGVRLEGRGHIHSSRENDFYPQALEIAKRQDYTEALKVYKEVLKFCV